MSEDQLNYQFLQINVDGVPYRWEIDPEQYTERDIVDFAPRAGGGDVAYSNLDLYQIYTQDSWHHGFGFVQARDKFGYRITDGDIDTRHIGMVMQATAYAVDYNEATANSITTAVDFKQNTYFAAGSGIWKRATATGAWTKVYTAGGGGRVVSLISNGDYLIAGIDTAQRMVTSQDGTTWTNAGPTGNPPNGITHLCLHGGFVWGVDRVAVYRTLTGTSLNTGVIAAGSVITLTGSNSQFISELKQYDFIKVGATLSARVQQVHSQTSISIYVLVGATLSGGEAVTKLTNSTYSALHFWSATDSSDAEGGGVADVSAIVVGAGAFNVNNLASFNGSLYIGREDGIWVVDESASPPLARRVVDFSNEASSSNCRIFIPWKGRLYFNINNALYAYTGSSMVDVTPPTYSLKFPPAAFGQFGNQSYGDNAAYRGSYLYVVAKSNESANDTCLLVFDGTGWHKLVDFGTNVITGIAVSVYASGLFVGCSTYGVGVRLIRFQPGTELPYGYFDTTVGRNYIDLSEIDAGFRRVPKSFAEVDLELDAPSGTGVVAYYYDTGQFSGNAEGWMSLGQVNSSGVRALTFNPTYEDYKLMLRLYFQTSNSAKSAILRNVTVKYMVRPNVLYGHKLVIMGSDYVRMLDGRTLPASSAVQRAWLKAARASRAPVTLVTPFGETKQAYISTLMFSRLQRRPGEARSNWMAVINVVEVG